MDEQTEASAAGLGENSAPAQAAAPNLAHAEPGSGSGLGGDVQARIGQHLRAMYDDVVRQGVPDRFMDLLSRLDEKVGASGTREEEAGR